MSQEVEVSLLVVVVDTNPGQRLLQQKSHFLTQCLDSVVAFVNSHLMLKPSNKAAVLACHMTSTDLLFPPSTGTGPQSVGALRQQDGQYELFTHVEKSLRQNLQQLVRAEVDRLHSGAPVVAPRDSLLAGALAMALCYVHRLEREMVSGCKMNSRVLVITGSSDSASQYMNYMNVFFTAQKQSVTIDVCSLDQELGLLQQGCDITGGLYLQVPQLQGLLQYLLWVFLPEPPIRTKLVLPPPVKVDYRAACFCHRELIDIGFVCSVCLSIFCKFSPICTTCHTVFKSPGPLQMKLKKKKMKLN